MANLYTEFQELFPADPVTYGEVVAHTGDGKSRVELPAGDQVLVSGQSVPVGGFCWMRGGQVDGEAPDLPAFTVDV